MDTIAMVTYPFMAGAARAVDDVGTQQDPALRLARAMATCLRRRFWARRGQANDGENRRLILLANVHSPRDNRIIAHLSPAQIAPKSRLRRIAIDRRGH